MDKILEFASRKKDSGLKGILDEIMDDLGLNRKKVPIKPISNELKKKLMNCVDRLEDLKDEMAFKTEQLAKKAQKQIKDEYEDTFNKIVDEKKEIWDEIADEIGVSRDLHLNFDSKTGMISKWEKADK